MECFHQQYIQAMDLYRFNGKWYKVNKKPYEPESQTAQLVWSQLREPELSIPEHYKRFYEKQRKEARILYPSFRKDDN